MQLSSFLDKLFQNGVKSIDQTQYYIPFDQRREAQRKCLTVC
jgi:hypothetical protein